MPIAVEFFARPAEFTSSATFDCGIASLVLKASIDWFRRPGLALSRDMPVKMR